MKVIDILAAVLLATCPAVAAAQTTYHVDATAAGASDSSPGTAGSPWLTIGKCASTLVAGDTCLVAPGGTYDERVSESTSGTGASPVVYRADAGTRPRVRGFTLTGDYIHVEGFEITNDGMSTDTNRSIVFTSADGIEIVGNYIHDTAREAIHAMDFSGPSDRAQNCVIRGNVIEAIGPPTDRAVAVGVSADSCLMEQNDVSRFEDAFRVFGRRNVLRNNVVHGATRKSSRMCTRSHFTCTVAAYSA